MKLKLPFKFWVEIYSLKLRNRYFEYIHFPIKFFYHRLIGRQTYWYEEYLRIKKETNLSKEE